MPDRTPNTSPATTRGRACRRYLGADGGRYCGNTPTRLYAAGPRCAEHTPAAVAGRPEASGQYCAPGRHYCLAAGTPCATAPRPWRLLVTGSRNHQGKAFIWQVLDGYHAAHPHLVIVHGACYPRPDRDGSLPDTSADWLTHLWCQARGVPDEPHPADWRQHGDAAGPLRNQAMVNLGADECAAFPHGDSPGTHDCMRRARKAGIHVERWAE